MRGCNAVASLLLALAAVVSPKTSAFTSTIDGRCTTPKSRPCRCRPLPAPPLHAAPADSLLKIERNKINAIDATDDSFQEGIIVTTDGMLNLLNEDLDPERQQDTYRNGLFTIGFITLLFASNSPALRSVFELSSKHPPVLLINSAVTLIGLVGVLISAPFLSEIVQDPSEKVVTNESSDDNFLSRVVGLPSYAGFELGLWKTLGTTANIYGLSQTSSDHGAFLIQLTTLIVPSIQGIMGVPIPSRIWTAIGLALCGVFVFAQDPSQSASASLQGDLMCALAAIFYAAYDLRLFKWGKLVATNKLITTKMMTQSALSLGLLLCLSREESISYISTATQQDAMLVTGSVLWSGFAVNCVAPFLQVSGQQAVGPARAQILYASQPLWAAGLSFLLLGEQFGRDGFIGGSAFIVAMYLAATAEMPDPNCPAEECEI